jgi:hypothetical protein
VKFLRLLNQCLEYTLTPDLMPFVMPTSVRKPATPLCTTRTSLSFWSSDAEI